MHCHEVQSHLFHADHEAPEFRAACEDHLSTCSECAEFATNVVTVRDEVGEYGRMIRGMEPSERHRYAMERTLVQLVETDVQRRFRQTSIRSRAVRGWRRLAETWRSLSQNSGLFRLATQGTVLAGVGLMVALFVEGTQESTRAADLEPATKIEDQRIVPADMRQIPEPEPKDRREFERRTNRIPREGLGERIPQAPRKGR